MFDRIASLTTRRPWRVLALTVVGFLASVVLGAPVAGLLNSDSDSFSDNSSQSAQARDLLEDASGVAPTPGMVVLIDNDVPGIERSVRAVLTQHQAVARVDGGATPQTTSDDRSQSFLAVSFRADADADAATEALKDELSRVDGVSVGGEIPAYQEVNHNVESDLVKAEIIAFPLLFLVALWVFRSAVAALLPLLVGALTIVFSLLVLRGVNEASRSRSSRSTSSRGSASASRSTTRSSWSPASARRWRGSDPARRRSARPCSPPAAPSPTRP